MGRNDEVRLAEHDPRWPLMAEAEIARLTALSDGAFTAMHHIGSTAVPGMIAKPIIDLVAVADSLDAVDALRDELEAAGYAWHGEYGIEGRRYCSFDDPETGDRLFHLHAYADGHEAIAEHLAFRDRLRDDPAVAAAYQAEKRRSAALHPHARSAYTAEKAPWVRTTIDRILDEGAPG